MFSIGAKSISYARAALLALGALILIGASLYYYYFRAEHLIYKTQDARTGMKLLAVCKWGGLSYHTYVIVKAPSGREISRNEIPYSADTLSDCKEQSYYAVVAITPDAKYKKLTVRFKGNRAPVEVPLLLENLDLPTRPWEASGQDRIGSEDGD